MLPPEWQPQVTFPLIPGTDISSVVELVADDVEGFSAGDEIYDGPLPRNMQGDSKTYAKYVSIPASQVALKPTEIEYVHAGAPIPLLTAWQFLVELGHDAPNALQPQQHAPVPLKDRTVLVNGLAGGGGHFAVQIAKLKGAHVIAVALGKHEAMLRDVGAGEFIYYT